MKLRRLSTQDKNIEGKLKVLTRYDAAQDPAVQKAVRRILADVRKRGDAAVRAYTKKFDGVVPQQFAVSDRLAGKPHAHPGGTCAARRRSNGADMKTGSGL